jgi:hypothetical protein
VEADLAVLGYWFGDELGSSTLDGSNSDEQHPF